MNILLVHSISIQIRTFGTCILWKVSAYFLSCEEQRDHVLLCASPWPAGFWRFPPQAFGSPAPQQEHQGPTLCEETSSLVGTETRNDPGAWKNSVQYDKVCRRLSHT